MINFKKTITILIGLAILIGSFGMCFPILGSTFSPYYAVIAKHIALSNNWTDLILSGQDWLDKPHFPFWITAISFKIFGINSFAYILPGFIFNLIGGLYTYKLAKLWYDEKVSVIAVLLYFTTLHLMLSAIDIRAEAYLLGEIMPACYYFLIFDRQKTIKALLLASFFSGLAMMTKGIFVMVTIASGLVCLWIYQKRFKNFIDWKWYLAIILSVLFTLPEIISLYIQFDIHPDKIVFGVQHVSGVRWFFWDSQFGRFFNTGPIATTNPMPYHWLFFVHTFLWAFLPWWPIFFGALYTSIKNIRKPEASEELNGSLDLSSANVYFMSSFFTTFILFSATSFQVDHYTNIIFPFACIICAKWLLDLCKVNELIINRYNKIIICIEIFFSAIFLSASIIISIIAFAGYLRITLVATTCIITIVLIMLRKKYGGLKCVVFPVVSILTLFVTIMCVNGIEYAKYDAGYNIAQELNRDAHGEIIGYKMDDMPLKSLDFYSKNHYTSSENLDTLQQSRQPFYIVTSENELKLVQKKFQNTQVYMNFNGCQIGTFMANILHKDKLQSALNKYVVIKVN